MNVEDSFYSLYCTVIPDSGFRIPDFLGFRVAHLDNRQKKIFTPKSSQ